MNDKIYIVIILILIVACGYIFISKNNEIDELSKKTGTSSETVPLNIYNTCMSNLQTLDISYNELQEQCNSTSVDFINSLASFTLGEQQYFNIFS